MHQFLHRLFKGENLKPKYFFLIFFIFLSFGFTYNTQNLSSLDFAYGLNYSVEISPKIFYTSPTNVVVKISIFNSYPSDLSVYLLSKKGETYQVEQLLGSIPKNKLGIFQFSYQTEYNDKRFTERNFAILASGYEVPVGFYFSVKEDWSYYEKDKYLDVLNNAKFLIPFGGLALFVIISSIAIINFYFLHKKEQMFFDFLFFDFKKFNKESFISNPFFWFIYILLAIFIFSIFFTITDKIEEGSFTPLLMSFLFALSIPILFFCLVWLYSIFIERISFRYILGSFFWGVVVGLFAILINSSFSSLFISNKLVSLLLFVSFFVPVIEEFLKGLGIFFLFDNKKFKPLDGLLFGFSIGFGFAFIENLYSFSIGFFPLTLGSFSWASLFLYNGFFGSLAHACFTGFFGFSIFWLKEKFSTFYPYLLFLNALILPILFHSIFNLTSSLDSLVILEKGFFSSFYNPTIVLLLVGINLLLLFFSTIQKKYLK